MEKRRGEERKRGKTERLGTQILDLVYSLWAQCDLPCCVQFFLLLFCPGLGIYTVIGRTILLYFCIGRPIHCNHYVGHYSGFSGISRSILNRFAPNLQA